MDDIVERLRWRIHTSEDETALTNEAADEIERLRKESRLYWDAFQKAANEIERLRLDMALTREALEKINTLLGKNIHIKERAKEARSILLDILYPDRHDDK